MPRSSAGPRARPHRVVAVAGAQLSRRVRRHASLAPEPIVCPPLGHEDAVELCGTTIVGDRSPRPACRRRSRSSRSLAGRPHASSTGRGAVSPVCSCRAGKKTPARPHDLPLFSSCHTPPPIVPIGFVSLNVAASRERAANREGRLPRSSAAADAGRRHRDRRIGSSLASPLLPWSREPRQLPSHATVRRAEVQAYRASRKRRDHIASPFLDPSDRPVRRRSGTRRGRAASRRPSREAALPKAASRRSSESERSRAYSRCGAARRAPRRPRTSTSATTSSTTSARRTAETERAGSRAPRELPVRKCPRQTALRTSWSR